MQIKNVRLASIVADENNPRQDFGDLDALAASFAGNGGQPWNPPIVVADGSIFRIVDGERRIRAMRSLGEGAPEEVACVVCEGMDERDAAVAMVATDDKRRLTGEEKSRGTQQMLLLGVDDDIIDAAAHLEPGSARRARRGRSVAGEAGDQMTFDRLFAIGELADEGETEAMAAVLEADDDEWRHVLYARRETIRCRNAVERSLDALREAGVEAIDERPEGYEFVMTLSRWVEPDSVVSKAVFPSGSVCVADMGRGSVTVYSPSAKEEVDPEEQARMEEAAELAQVIVSVDKQMDDWLYAELLSDRPLPHVSEWAMYCALNVEPYYMPHFVERSIDDGTELPGYGALSGLPLALVIGQRVPDLPHVDRLRSVFMHDAHALSEWVHDNAVKWVRAWRAFRDDGFVPAADATGITIKAIRELVAWADDESWNAKDEEAGDEHE